MRALGPPCREVLLRSHGGGSRADRPADDCNGSPPPRVAGALPLPHPEPTRFVGSPTKGGGSAEWRLGAAPVRPCSGLGQQSGRWGGGLLRRDELLRHERYERPRHGGRARGRGQRFCCRGGRSFCGSLGTGFGLEARSRLACDGSARPGVVHGFGKRECAVFWAAAGSLWAAVRAEAPGSACRSLGPPSAGARPSPRHGLHGGGQRRGADAAVAAGGSGLRRGRSGPCIAMRDWRGQPRAGEHAERGGRATAGDAG